MIWHIFKKDWKLLRWQAVIVVALASGSFFADMGNGYFGGIDANRGETALGVLAFLAGLVLVTQLVQSDPIPGGAQDWLVRPVKGIDLLLAKMLFILVALLAPILLIIVVAGLAQGFPLGTTSSEDALNMLFTTVSLGLVALAFASLFRGLTETVAATFAVVLAVMAGGFLVMGKASFPLVGPTTGTGVHWVVDLSENSLYLLGAIAVLAIQYLRRQTVRARWVAAAFFALTRLAPLMPWQTAFAVQEQMAPVHGSAASVALAFDPTASAAGACIPLTVSGLAPDTWLNVDGVSASLIDSTGNVAWTTRIPESSVGVSSPLNVIRGDFKQTANSGRCQPVPIDTGEMDRLAHTPGLRARLEYSLTLFVPDKSYAMPVVSSASRDQILPGVGRCRTQVGDQVKLGCMTQKAPTCGLAFLLDKTTGDRSPAVYSCEPNYDPWDAGSSPWGASLSIPWGNLPHQANNDWQLILRTYKARDHFTRQLTTPEIKLRN